MATVDWRVDKQFQVAGICDEKGNCDDDIDDFGASFSDVERWHTTYEQFGEPEVGTIYYDAHCTRSKSVVSSTSSQRPEPDSIMCDFEELDSDDAEGPTGAHFGALMNCLSYPHHEGGWSWQDNSCHLDTWAVCELAAVVNRPDLCDDNHYLVTKSGRRLYQLLESLCQTKVSTRNEARNRYWDVSHQGSSSPFSTPVVPRGTIEDVAAHVRNYVGKDLAHETSTYDRTIVINRTLKCCKCDATTEKPIKSPYLTLVKNWTDQPPQMGRRSNGTVTPKPAKPVRTIVDSVGRLLFQQDTAKVWCLDCKLATCEQVPTSLCLQRFFFVLGV